MRLDIYPTEDFVRHLDRWRGAQPDVPTRAEAARRIVEQRLLADGVIKPARKRKMR